MYIYIIYIYNHHQDQLYYLDKKKSIKLNTVKNEQNVYSSSSWPSLILSL